MAAAVSGRSELTEFSLWSDRFQEKQTFTVIETPGNKAGGNPTIDL